MKLIWVLGNLRMINMFLLLSENIFCVANPPILVTSVIIRRFLIPRLTRKDENTAATASHFTVKQGPWNEFEHNHFSTAPLIAPNS